MLTNTLGIIFHRNDYAFVAHNTIAIVTNPRYAKAREIDHGT